MDIKDFLSPAEAMVDVQASDKSQLLNDLSMWATSALKLDHDIVAGEILKREELGSTGIGEGVAIPHARIPGLKVPFGILARLKRPLEFEAIDGQPVDVVFFLLLPGAAHGTQLNALAAVARRLRDKDTIKQLRSVADGAALYRAMIDPAAQD
jgi:PTS system nitrogen regulatory IIA component